MVYLHLGEPSQLFSAPSNFVMPKSESFVTPRFDALQTQLKADKQNGKLWFELGHEYMARGEFDNASTVFHYAERLSSDPAADIFSAQATARYYANKQRFDDQVQTWLNEALKRAPNNASAHMLIASDHFLSARYPLAIEHWETILDANHPDIDRVAIITSIHQAKRML
ncbi:nitrite reductase [Enterovibrio sp. ZSDZ42]|uniref:Nitrite reductase n=1 Tax=Enterovibrio gelatinilyticus TaxID=2899819 RepID=A0ABT5R509_9GAMM|nr:nitrite reductase [Enterovibrio sp. ZSDZ42]MDD1795074.1 nitrite reductase [Enterovibrio sp. ZSDZ42]